MPHWEKDADAAQRLAGAVENDHEGSIVMNIRFYIDPETNLPHILRHEVDENEVSDVLMYPGEDRPGKEGARVAIGQTEAGRYLRVIYVPDPTPNSVFVITACELTGKPLKAYKRRCKGRRRQ